MAFPEKAGNREMWGQVSLVGFYNIRRFTVRLPEVDVCPSVAGCLSFPVLLLFLDPLLSADLIWNMHLLERRKSICETHKPISA